jgi:hypothetical protein
LFGQVQLVAFPGSLDEFFEVMSAQLPPTGRAA